MVSRAATYAPDELAGLSRELEERGPEAVLRWAVDRFFPELALACSFGGPSGVVLVDMIARLEPGVEVFYLDTGFLFPETYETRDRVIARYGIHPVTYRSELTPEEQARQHGDGLWQRSPDLCCFLRKVEPNRRALAGKSAWISGVRRDQGATRQKTPAVQRDERFGLIKVNPLVRWTEADVWSYIAENEVPYNPLHDLGFPSIGCTHCTEAVKPGDGPRSGRWKGRRKEECGLHSPGRSVRFAREDEKAG